MYFISPDLYIKYGGPKGGLGVYAKRDIPENTAIELSPISSCYKTDWESTHYQLKKIVFSFPMNTDNYVVALGYIACYNHDDNNNSRWYSCDVGIGIYTIRQILKDEEITINYGEGYWKNGWTKI